MKNSKASTGFRNVVKVSALIMSLLLGTLVPGTSSPVWSQVKTIKIDGSSTVYPITEAVAEEFQKMKKGAVKVTVGISGTGGGFKKFSRGETDISDASRPIVKKEMEGNNLGPLTGMVS